MSDDFHILSPEEGYLYQERLGILSQGGDPTPEDIRIAQEEILSRRERDNQTETSGDLFD